MIDTVNIHVNIEPPAEVTERIPVKFMWNGIVFAPNYSRKNQILIDYKGNYENLFLTFNDRGLYLGNSWHKLYHGKNWNDYFFTEIVKTYNALNNRFNGMIENAKIIHLDYGVNITADPAEVYENWEYLNGKRPKIEDTRTGREYGLKFKGTEYQFKGYDKTFEVKREKSIIVPAYQITRLEKSVFKMRTLNRRKINRVPIFTGKDLINQENIRKLADDFLLTYQNIEKMEKINYKGLSATEKKIIAIMQNHELREVLKIENPETYRKDLRTYKRLKQDKIVSTNIQELIIEKVANLVSA